MIFCNECNDRRLFKKGNLIFNETKVFDGNLYLIKGQFLNQPVHMLPYFKDYDSSFCNSSIIIYFFLSFYFIQFGQFSLFFGIMIFQFMFD